jgi:DNA-binding CsgD family transcriptional regulator
VPPVDAYGQTGTHSLEIAQRAGRDRLAHPAAVGRTPSYPTPVPRCARRWPCSKLQLRARGQEQKSVDGIQLQLTRPEADVMTRLRDGLTRKQIAYELETSAVTVRRHRSSVARKARQARPLTLALESTS